MRPTLELCECKLLPSLSANVCCCYLHSVDPSTVTQLIYGAEYVCEYHLHTRYRNGLQNLVFEMS